MNRRQFVSQGAAFGLLPALAQHGANAQVEACLPATPGLGNVVVSFESIGASVSPQFDLAAGTYVVRANNTIRDSFFALHLLPVPGTGEPFEDVIITFGTEFGPGAERSWAKTAEAGRYVLSVEGEGDWSIVVEQ